eukprot:COSAG02_NODE_70955_length_193_cov_21.297872_1_plen_27_part_10
MEATEEATVAAQRSADASAAAEKQQEE